MLYLLLKTIHILAVVVFIGNITTGVMWKFHADRSGDPRLMAHALAGIIRSDRRFTVPGVILIVASGVPLAMVGGFPVLGTFWIWTALLLFSISGVLFGVWVGPAQRNLLQVAAAPQFDRQRYDRLSRTWAVSGFGALATPLAALALMVFKPAGLG